MLFNNNEENALGGVVLFFFAKTQIEKDVHCWRVVGIPKLKQK